MTLEELVEFTRDLIGMSREEWGSIWEILKDDAAMNRQMKKEWFEKPRDSEAAIIDYYRESKIWFVNTFAHGYLALLMLANRDPSLSPKQMWQTLFEAELDPGAKVLDYGGGFWNDTAHIVIDGWTVVQGEVEGRTTDFLEKFAKLIGMSERLEVLKVKSDRPLLETYGGITCFETLEHLLYPQVFTGHLRDHLASGKPFAFSVSFGAPEHAPYHVATNEPLGREGVWAGVMKEIGFDHLWSAQDSHRHLWKKR